MPRRPKCYPPLAQRTACHLIENEQRNSFVNSQEIKREMRRIQHGSFPWRRSEGNSQEIRAFSRPASSIPVGDGLLRKIQRLHRPLYNQVVTSSNKNQERRSLALYLNTPDIKISLAKHSIHQV